MTEQAKQLLTFGALRDIEAGRRKLYQFTGHEIGAYADGLTQILGKITASATGIPFGNSLLEAQFQRVLASDIVLLQTENDSPVAYGAFTTMPFDNSLMLYEAAKMVVTDHQSKGYGHHLTQEAIQIVKPSLFAVRTQNPHEARSVIKSFPNLVMAPIRGSYAQFPDLQQALFEITTRLGIEEYDPNTGLCPRLYGKRFGNYEVNTSDPHINTIEERYRELGLNRDIGDTIFHIGYFA